VYVNKNRGEANVTELQSCCGTTCDKAQALADQAAVVAAYDAAVKIADWSENPEVLRGLLLDLEPFISHLREKK